MTDQMKAVFESILGSVPTVEDTRNEVEDDIKRTGIQHVIQHSTINGQ